MSDDHDQPDAPPGADAPDTSVEQIIPPEQPPVDDAAGGPTVDPDDDTYEENLLMICSYRVASNRLARLTL